MAVLGGIASVYPPSKTWVKAVYFTAFVVLGIATIVCLVLQSKEMKKAQLKADQEQERLRTQIRGLEAKLDEYNRLVQKEIAVEQERKAGADEMGRRKRILALLHREYILSHDNLSPGMLAGTEPLPKEWVESRLRQLAETWRQGEYRPY